MADRRIDELDGLRGVAVLLVVFAHASAGMAAASGTLIPGHPIHSGGGIVGVQLFFVLSGYLITRLLLAEQAGGRVSLRAFYGRRARRLLPALVVVCAGVLVLGRGTPHETGTSVLHALSYTADVLRDGGGWLDHTWSLAVEEQFYLAWPLLLLAAWRWRERDGVAIAAGVGIVATIALRHTGWFGDETVYAMLRWDALAAGCLLAARPIRPPAWTTVAGLTVIVAYTAQAPAVMPAWHYAVLTAACAAVVAGAPTLPWLRARWLRWFGTISYALYLWHPVIAHAGLAPIPAVAVAVAVAWVSTTTVEARWRSGRPVEAPHLDVPVVHLAGVVHQHEPIGSSQGAW